MSKLQKLKLRAKKHWSTRVASTSKGQDLIIQALGPHGEEMFQMLEDSMAIHFGSDAADDFRTDLLKIALKTGVLMDEGELKVEDAQELDKPFRDLCFQLTKDLEGGNADEKQDEVDPQQLITCFSTMKEVTLPLFESLIQQKNLDKITFLYDTLSNEDYLRFVLNDSEMKDCREVLREGLAPMLDLISQLELEEKPPELCRAWRCQNREVKSVGLFRGVGLCPTHYNNRLGVVLENPRLDEFIEFKFLTVHFLDFLQHRRFYVDAEGAVQEVDEKDEAWEVDAFGNSKDGAYRSKLMHYYYFCESVRQYEVIQARQLRQSRAKKIIDKYVAIDNARRYVFLPEEIVAQLISDHADVSCTKTTFSEALNFTNDIMAEVFSHFTSTVYYERAAASVTLPEEE